MRVLASKLGIVAFWLAWPAYFFYLRLSHRTRVLLVHDNEVLVIRGWMSDGKWSLPGGGMHRDETPLQGAVRELKEEVGIELRPDELRPVGEAVYRAYGHKFPFYCFIVEATKSVPLKLQWYEISHAEWVDWRSLNTRNAGADVMLSLRAWLG